MDVWNALAHSDPQYLKPVSFGSRSFTAIDPQYQVKKMTEYFGQIGTHWGWHNTTEIVNLSNGDSAVLAHVTVWTRNQHDCFGPFTGCRKFFDASKGRLAEDAPKMAITQKRCLTWDAMRMCSWVRWMGISIPQTVFLMVRGKHGN
jgi:hypothetical protein